MSTETLKPSDLIAPSPAAPATELSDANANTPPPPPADGANIARSEVQELAPDEAAALTREPERDARGVAFDPDKHLSRDGKPVRHPKTGCFMPRRRSVAETAEGSPSFVAPDEPAPAASAEAAEVVTAAGPDVPDAMADLHCKAFYGIAVAFLSDEWLPTKAEHAANKSTLAAYYRAKGITPDKPGVALLAQLAAFAGPRLQMPKTQTRLGAFKAWLGAKWMAWQGARRAARLNSATQ